MISASVSLLVSGFAAPFFDGRTPCTAIVRHLLPVPLVDIGGVEVSLCAVHVAWSSNISLCLP